MGAFSSLHNKTPYAQCKEEKFILTHGSEGSVHVLPHGGRAWAEESYHFMTVRKQKEKERAKAGVASFRVMPQAPTSPDWAPSHRKSATAPPGVSHISKAPPIST